MDDIVITGMGAVCSIGDCCYEMLKTMRADLFGIVGVDAFFREDREYSVFKSIFHFICSCVYFLKIVSIRKQYSL